MSTSRSLRAGRARLAAGLALAGVAVLATAGCGGGARVFRVDNTKACLEKAGVQIVPVDFANDFVASSALAGTLGAKLALNRVTISFGRDAAEGQLIEAAYAKYGSKDVPIDQVLERDNNAVLLWAGQPSKQDDDIVRSCLK